MKIIEKSYKWNGSLSKRSATKYIILHHMAGFGSPDDIHRIHLNNGWTGIGYHFFVRQDGSVYRGRPLEMVGAHCPGRNSDSIGICFEGNYETNKNMPEKQFKAGQELITYINSIYKNSLKINKHSDHVATACPGKNFPFNSIIVPIVSKLETTEDIIEELYGKKIISNKELWTKLINEDKNIYWLCQKGATIVRNETAGPHDGPILERANDIAWYLGYKGVMSEVKYWKNRMESEKDTIYWLCYKLAAYLNTH